MPNSRIPSTSRSQGAPITPRRDRPRRSRSVTSPALSTASGRLTTVIEHFKENNMDSFALSPLNSRRSVLTDNTDIEEPKRRSWWNNLKENSRDVIEVLEGNKLDDDNQVFEELFDVEVLSQEKNNYALDLPESSGSESINSIVLPQRKLFTQRDNKAKTKFGQLIFTRESLAKQKHSTTSHDKSLKAGTKELFQGTKRSKPIFPAALLNITPNKTIFDVTKELPAEPIQTRNIFVKRPVNERKNMFANFIVSDSEDEIPEIQSKVFGFRKKVDQVHEPGPQPSNVTNDIDMDDWKHLPSSTMVEHQLEEMMRDQTPVKRARLESHETEPNTSRRSVSKRFGHIQANIIDENVDESPKSVHKTLLQMLESADEDNSDGDIEDGIDNQGVNKDDTLDGRKTDNNVEIQRIVNDAKDNEKNASTRLDNNGRHPERNDDNLVSPKPGNKCADKSQQKNTKFGNVSLKNNKDDESGNHGVALNNPEKDNEINTDKKVDENEAIDNIPNESEVIENENQQIENEVNESEIIQHETNEDDKSEVNGTKDVVDEEEIESEHENPATTNENLTIEHQMPEQAVDNNINNSANSDEHNDAEDNDEVEHSGDVSLEVEIDENEDKNDENIDEEVDDEVNISHEIESSANESHINEVSVNESEVDDDGEESDTVNDQESENKESDQEMEDSTDADKAIASDEAEPDDEQEMDVDEEESEELKYESDVEENGEQNASTVEIEETPNKTHDTTGRNRKKELEKSPEVIVRDTSNHVDSFTAPGNNTSIRKTMSKSLHIRPSMAPPRESTSYSTEEGSGWDSHRTTRKTLRQTFGKDFTLRKSLRALVMEKSAKRQTEHLDIQSDTVEFPRANSTELPDESTQDVGDLVEESDHEVSIMRRQNILETHLQRIKEERLKIREEVRSYIKLPARDPLNIFIVPTKPAPRRPKPSQKPKKQIKTITPFGSLPSELIEDLKYKPPKKFMPASWTTKRLYKFLETKLEPKYDYKARIRAEKLVETIYNFVKDIRRHKTAPVDAVNVLKHEMARLDIVKTHFEFYDFFHEYMPREVRIKVVPDIVNMIPLPKRGVFADILNTIQ